MRRLVLIGLILFACTSKDVRFEYFVSEVKEHSGIVIQDFKTTEKKSLEKFLRSIQEKEKLDSVNVFLTGDNISAINPLFKQYYFSREENIKALKWNSNDSLKLLLTTRIWIGTFKGGEFVPNPSAYISTEQILGD